MLLPAFIRNGVRKVGRVDVRNDLVNGIRVQYYVPQYCVLWYGFPIKWWTDCKNGGRVLSFNLEQAAASHLRVNNIAQS